MTAYAIVSLRLRDRAWMREYNTHVPAIVESYGGAYVAMGKNVVVVEGVTDPPDRVAILKFPSIQALQDCMADPGYAPYRAMRIAAADTEIIGFEEF